MCDQILLFVGGVASGIVLVCFIGWLMIRKIK